MRPISPDETWVDVAVGAAVTLPRYACAERAAQRVSAEEPITVEALSFIGADVLDGALLRRFGMDGPTRRMMDGVVDHVSQARVMLEIARKYPESRQYYGLLALRAGGVGIINYLHLRATGEVTKGQNWQRSANLAAAAFTLVAVQGNVAVTKQAGRAAVGVSLVTGLAHLRGFGKKHTEGIRRI